MKSNFYVINNLKNKAKLLIIKETDKIDYIEIKILIKWKGIICFPWSLLHLPFQGKNED